MPRGVVVRAKAKSSKTASEPHDSADREAMESPRATAESPTAVPSFDPAPLEDLKSVMEGAKFAALVTQLTQGLETRLERLAALLDASSWSEAAQGAHDIVSVAGNVGAARLSALARILEISCKSGSETERRSASTQLRSEAVDALRVLKSYRTAA